MIPKSLRLIAGIEPNSELEMISDGTGIRLDPVSRHRRTIDAPDGFPRLVAVVGQMISDHEVVELRDRDQR